MEVEADSTRELGQRMQRETWMLAGFMGLLCIIVIGANLAAQHYRGLVPSQVSVGLRAIHVVCMILGIVVCIRTDASTRGIPRTPAQPKRRRNGRMSAIEDLVPGATPTVLALLLPWAIDSQGHSTWLSLANLCLATATTVSAIALIYRASALARMREVCRASGLARTATWRRFNPERSASIALVAWLALLATYCVIATLANRAGTSTLDRAAAAALALGGVLWLVAFRDVRRECDRTCTWLGARDR
jgi:disulfide bond formation protein DsbB